MSSREQRLHAPVATIPGPDFRTLAEVTERFGAPLLDDAHVERMMFASSLGLDPNAWAWGVRWWQRRRSAEEWRVFPYEEYALYDAEVRQRIFTPTFGRPVPLPIAARVALIKQHLPTATFEVYALKSDDPFVRVTDGVQKGWVGGWRGHEGYRGIYMRYPR